MKRLFSMLLVLLVLSLAACGGSNTEGPVTDGGVELTVFAAASRRQALTEAGARDRKRQRSRAGHRCIQASGPQDPDRGGGGVRPFHFRRAEADG